MDLGDCPKLHDLALRADYENAAKHKDYYYDIDVSIIIFSIYISLFFINNCFFFMVIVWKYRQWNIYKHL